jgi:uncharacterized membrane protein required for colicin V production
LNSIVSPLLGIWFALRKCDDLAIVLYRLVGNYTVARVAGFLIILICIWLALKLTHKLLFKLVDWPRCDELDRFLGGCLGLAKGVVLAWAILATTLSTFPPSVRIIEQSNASVRLLALGEKASGPVPEKGEGSAESANPFQGFASTLAMLSQLRHGYGTPAP